MKNYLWTRRNIKWYNEFKDGGTCVGRGPRSGPTTFEHKTNGRCEACAYNNLRRWSSYSLGITYLHISTEIFVFLSKNADAKIFVWKWRSRKLGHNQKLSLCLENVSERFGTFIIFHPQKKKPNNPITEVSTSIQSKYSFMRLVTLPNIEKFLKWKQFDHAHKLQHKALK